MRIQSTTRADAHEAIELSTANLAHGIFDLCYEGKTIFQSGLLSSTDKSRNEN